MAKEEFLSIRIIKIKAYRNHPKLIWAPAPQVFNLKLNKHLWLVSVGDASWLNFNSSPYQRGPTRVSGRGLICGKKTFNSRSSVRALQASGKKNCQKTTKNNTHPHPPHPTPKTSKPWSTDLNRRGNASWHCKTESRSWHHELSQLQGGKRQEEFVQAEEIWRWKYIAHLEFVLSATRGFFNGKNTSPSCVLRRPR